jgi:hypothetical protein
VVLSQQGRRLAARCSLSVNLPGARFAMRRPGRSIWRGYFASVARALIIEFVPKDDSQVQRMLATREDVFGDYTQEGFERALTARFDIEARFPLTGSRRIMYAMRRRDS